MTSTDCMPKRLNRKCKRRSDPIRCPSLAAKHPLYSSFFAFPDGPPRTTHELNGWGDNIVHDYLRGVERRGRLGVLYSNKDYGCEWDYDWRNKRFRTKDNTKFARECRRVRDDLSWWNVHVVLGDGTPFAFDTATLRAGGRRILFHGILRGVFHRVLWRTLRRMLASFTAFASFHLDAPAAW